MRICVNYASVRFEKFDGTDRWNLMKEGKPVLIMQGEYTIGRDLLPGSYTFTSDRFSSILLYDAEDSEYSVDSYSLEEPDFMVGKIRLLAGMKIEICYGAMTFEPIKKLGF